MLTMVAFHRKKAQSKEMFKKTVPIQLLSKEKNTKPPLNFPQIFLLGSLCDTPSSCRNLSRQIQLKAVAAGCLSHLYKGFPCHFIQKDVTLTSNSKYNYREGFAQPGCKFNAWLITTGSAHICLHRATLANWCSALHREGKCSGTMKVHDGSGRMQTHPSLNQTLQRWDQPRYGLQKVLCREPEAQGSFSQIAACPHTP